ncbi:MAG: tRNA-intron lyase [Candidatus Woesearchaeota archaeon]
MTKKETQKKEFIKSHLISDKVITEPSDQALELYNQSRFGTLLEDKKLQLSLIEALYLSEKGKILVYSNKKKLSFEELMKKAEKKEPNVLTRFIVFKDLRNRGYIVKTALKFGADFRVYERGFKPGEAHAKWIVYPVEEEDTITWYEFAAKNRVAHSTRKRLLIGIVDDENDVTYYEIKWTRP